MSEAGRHRASRDARPWFAERRAVDVSRIGAPTLLVVVDTEEEFDWNLPFDRGRTSVASLASIGRLQALCDEFGIRPTYMVDHPVASQPQGFEVLARYHGDGRARVGAHVHAWVTPPFTEVVDTWNSYQGHLPRALELAKLECLTATIEANFGFRPDLHKAGRYGFGPNTAGILAELGYRIDCSACVPFDLGVDGGPDFSGFTNEPFWFGRGLLELPSSGAFVGRAPATVGRRLYAAASHPGLRWTRAPGILSRLGIVDRLFLSPEGYRLAELVRLTRFLVRRGERVLSLTLHSPSFDVGHTPYVKDEADLRAFLSVLRDYFVFFLGELGGQTLTPFEVLDLVRPPTPPTMP